MGHDRQHYYSTSRRVDGRVVNKYIGHNDLGRWLAILAALRYVLRRSTAATRRATKTGWSQADEAMKSLDLALKPLEIAYREAAGYHRHKGQWRKRRVFRSRQPAEHPE